MKPFRTFFLFVIMLVLVFSCEKVPLGHDSDFIFDSCGGYWVYIPKSMLSDGDEVVVRFTRRNQELTQFSEIAGEKLDWVSPSHYIDSDHEVIVSKQLSYA